MSEMRRNIDFVRYTPQWDISWTFYVAGKATRLSEVSDEVLGITKKVLDIGNDFFIPTKMGYSLLIFSKDMPANKYFDRNVGPLAVIRREIVSDGGISFTQLYKDAQNVDVPEEKKTSIKYVWNVNPKEYVRYIGGVDIPESRTRFVLDGKDVFIDKHSVGLSTSDADEDIVEEQQVLNSEQHSDLLYLHISHSSYIGSNKHVEVSDPAYYSIDFWSYTNIWFEETEIGFANRSRLRHMLKAVYDSFDVVDTSFQSDVSQDKMNDVVFGLD